MNAAVTAYIWYLVVAGPGGGMVVMPTGFDAREQCEAAVVEYQKTPAPSGWSVSCLPAAAAFLGEGEPEEGQQ